MNEGSKKKSIQGETLFELMEKVLGDWVFLAATPLSKDLAVEPLPMEKEVRWSANGGGLLIFRSVKELGELLAREAVGAEAPSISGEDAFSELLNLFMGHLFPRLSGAERGASQAFLPAPSSSSGRPGRPADARCSFLVEEMPVEILFWQPLEVKA